MALPSCLPFPALVMEAIPPVCLSALAWFVADASLPFWTTGTAWGHRSSPSHVPLAVNLVNRGLQPYVLPSQKACFLVVFRQCFFFKPHNSISMVFHVTCLLVNFLGIQDGLEILFTVYVLVTPRENVPKVQKKNADQVWAGKCNISLIF